MFQIPTWNERFMISLIFKRTHPYKCNPYFVFNIYTKVVETVKGYRHKVFNIEYERIRTY